MELWKVVNLVEKKETCQAVCSAAWKGEMRASSWAVSLVAMSAAWTDAWRAERWAGGTEAYSV